MGSLRFPFSLPNPLIPPKCPSFPQSAALAVCAAGAGLAAAVSLSLEWSAGALECQRWEPLSSIASPIWASLSLAGGSPPAVFVEPSTRVAFPTVLCGRRRLIGAGVKKLKWYTNILDRYSRRGLIDYAFGVYADGNDLKRLGQKYGKFSTSELKENKEFIEDILDQDLCMTVRLQIAYNRLRIGTVRDTFAKTVGSRIQKFSGSENEKLLLSFTSLFKDEYKLPKGSVIDLSREQGYVLQVKRVLVNLFEGPCGANPLPYDPHLFSVSYDIVDGKDVGKIKSKLLCKSVLDLYIGEDPFDKQAKEKIQAGLASILLERSD